MSNSALISDVWNFCHTSLDIFWVKDERLGDLDNLPEPEELAAEITENIREALERFEGLRRSLP